MGALAFKMRPSMSTSSTGDRYRFSRGLKNSVVARSNGERAPAANSSWVSFTASTHRSKASGGKLCSGLLMFMAPK